VGQIYKTFLEYTYNKHTIMAKAKGKSASSTKVSFGKRKGGQAGGKKSYNKHNPRPKAYVGQGR